MIKAAPLAIIVAVVIGAIIYAIVMFEMYKRERGIFAPYRPPPAPPNTFYPLGSVKPMTADELARWRQAFKDPQ